MKFFKNALVADYVRGVHSTGIATLGHGGVDSFKLAIDPINFLDIKKVDDMLSTAKIGIMGHNRQATIGSVNAANAHPFTHGTITLMHNGTLSSGTKYKLEKEYGAPSFGTDSELICWLIDKFDLACVIKDLEGAFALTWFDTDDNSINFIHNGEREFNVLCHNGILYYASEAKMLRWLADRNGILEKDDKIYSPKIGMHVKYTYTNRALTMQAEQLEVAEKKTYTKATGKSRGTATSNVTSLVSTTVFDEFQKETGLALKAGSYIYAYPTSEYKTGVVLNTNLICSLAVDPYCTVAVYNCNGDSYLDPQIKGVKLVISRIYKDTNDTFRIVCAANVMKVMTDKQCKDMDDWVDYWSAPTEKEVNEPPTTSKAYGGYSGYQGATLKYKEFKAITDKGCCICASPLDAVDQVIDRTCAFVSPDDVVCEACASSEEVLQEYGFSFNN